MVSEAYDALSELNVNQYTVQSPTYSLRAEAALKQEAFEDAWKTAQVLFGNQCKTLGLDANNYEVCSWDVDYSGQGGRMAKGRNFLNSAYSAGAAPEALGGGEPIELNAGRAMVEVILTVNYTRKPL